MVAEALATIGSIALEALIQASIQTLANVMSSAISGAINGLASAVEGMSGAFGWLGNIAGDVLRNTGTQLNKIVNRGLGTVSIALQKTVGVYNAQEIAFRNLATWADKQTDEFVQWAGLQPKEKEALQDEVEKKIVDGAVARTEYMIDNGEGWLNNTYEGLDGWFSWMWEKTTKAASNVSKGVMGKISEGVGVVGQVFTNLKDKVKGLMDAAEGVIGAVIAGFTSAVYDFLNGLAAIVEEWMEVDPGEVMKYGVSTIGALIESLRVGKMTEEPFGGA